MDYQASTDPVSQAKTSAPAPGGVWPRVLAIWAVLLLALGLILHGATNDSRHASGTPNHVGRAALPNSLFPAPSRGWLPVTLNEPVCTAPDGRVVHGDAASIRGIVAVDREFSLTIEYETGGSGA